MGRKSAKGAAKADADQNTDGGDDQGRSEHADALAATLEPEAGEPVAVGEAVATAPVVVLAELADAGIGFFATEPDDDADPLTGTRPGDTAKRKLVALATEVVTRADEVRDDSTIPAHFQSASIALIAGEVAGKLDAIEDLVAKADDQASLAEGAVDSKAKGLDVNADASSHAAAAATLSALSASGLLASPEGVANTIAAMTERRDRAGLTAIGLGSGIAFGIPSDAQHAARVALVGLKSPEVVARARRLRTDANEVRDAFASLRSDLIQVAKGAATTTKTITPEQRLARHRSRGR